jgi:NitT/TauT family transport system ATP-binding protein
LIRIWARERTTTIYVTHNLNEAVLLAGRVVVLSRRPGRIARIVEVPVPASERRDPAHAAVLRTVQDELWSLLKHAAQAAEREMLSA